MTTAGQNICSNDDGDDDGMMHHMKKAMLWGEIFSYPKPYTHRHVYRVGHV